MICMRKGYGRLGGSYLLRGRYALLKLCSTRLVFSVDHHLWPDLWESLEVLWGRRLEETAQTLGRCPYLTRT